MKRIAGIFILLSLVAGSLVFVDDGLVLPQGVVRIRAIPSYTMLDRAYDNSGKSQDNIKGSVTAMSGAAEIGVIAPVTFGVQWAPGYYVANSIASHPSSMTGFSADKFSLFGAADIQVGAKLELLGTNGFVQNDKLRVALTPGVQIPLDNYDATTEADNAINGKTFRPVSSSSHQSYGFGAKADVDYQINDMFFINAHGEAKYFVPNDSLAFETVLTHEITYATVYATAFAGGATAAVADANATAYADSTAPLTNTKSEYGINSFFEIEPHAKYAVSDALSFSAGLPISYTMDLGTKSTYTGTSTTSDPESLLTVGPNVSCFALLGPLPVEMQLQ